MSMALQSSQLSWLAGTLPGNSHAEVTEKVLRDFYTRVHDFREELAGLNDQEFNVILLHSRETPTHYKWHLGTAPDTSFTLWLHEYKPRAIRSGGYAQTIHNHRYPMTALLLTGGYRYTQYDVGHTGADLATEVRMISSRRITGGAIYSMRESDFHSVTEIQDGTVSLLVQGRPRLPYSISVDAQSRLVSRHVPIEGRINNLRSTLATARRRLHHAEK